MWGLGLPSSVIIASCLSGTKLENLLAKMSQGQIKLPYQLAAEKQKLSCLNCKLVYFPTTLGDSKHTITILII
jgi:hypothetical protein